MHGYSGLTRRLRAVSALARGLLLAWAENPERSLAMNLPSVILVPTDFGEAASRAVDYALSLAKPLGAELVLLHTFELPLIGFPDGAMVATAELTSRIVAASQEALDKEVAARKDAGVPIKPILRQGDAWQMVLATAQETGANLIVMGTHGRRGLPRALIGSVAEKVVRTAPVPVLIVHAHDVDPRPSQSDVGERTVRTTP